jgi:hypothetical protein
MPDITADWHTLLRQASMTSNEYLARAVEHIDDTFGDGYAKRNPALVAAFIRSSSDDFNTASIKLASQDIRDGLIELGRALEQR